MPCDFRANDAASMLNQLFFLEGYSKNGGARGIQQEIDELRAKLRSLIVEQSLLQSRKGFMVEPEALRTVADMFPGLYISASTSETGVDVRLKTPLLFHDAYRETQEKEPVMYVTMPVYEFSMVINPQGQLAMRNVTPPLDDGQYTGFLYHNAQLTGMRYGHPHVRRAPGEGGVFRNICYGSNQFADLINPDFHDRIDGQTVVDLIRRFCIWASHANLSDMYDTATVPAFEINLGNFPVGEFFRVVQLAVIRKQPEPLGNFLGNHLDMRPGDYNSVVGLGYAYALWIYKNWDRLRLNSRYFGSRESLKAAVSVDIATAFHPLKHSRILNWFAQDEKTAELMLNAPQRLKEELGRCELAREILSPE